MSEQLSTKDKSNTIFAVPFSRIGVYFQLLLSLSILIAMFVWLEATYSDLLTGNPLIYSILSLGIFGFCFMTVIVLLTSGRGIAELIITEEYIIIHKTYYPFFITFFGYTSYRKAPLNSIKMTESAQIITPNWLLFFFGLMSFLLGIFVDIFLYRVPSQLNLQLDISNTPLHWLITSFGLFLMFYTTLISRKKFYQFRILFDSSSLLLPFLEQFCSTFFSSGIWVIRGHLGDAKKLFETGQKVLEEYNN
ncbi:MAG: hypothetical protein KAT16_10080 [Candidatus Heimdallarchaeota archaeon]|nr:hypothetical protein [Candidatus Heimdallarchaeota archaeon]